MKQFGIWIGILLGAVLLVWLLHCFVFSSYRILSSDMEDSLLPGERIIVNKWSYGLRTPYPSLFGYHRWMSRPVQKGDVVIFNNPMDTNHPFNCRQIYAYRCMAQPGDTISIDSCQLIIPKHGLKLHVSKSNITLFCNTILLHEGKKAFIKNDSLFVDNKPTSIYQFQKDYYWMSSDKAGNVAGSRYFGLVPFDHIIGRAAFIWFSKDNRYNWAHGYRMNRFFTSIK